MCFDPDATPPPIPPDARARASAIRSQDLVLTTDEGVQLSAYSSIPEGPQGPAVVVLPDVRGLFAYYKRLTERLASAGYHAVAIDYFARTAPDSHRGGDFEFMPHVRQMTVDQVQTDARAAAAYLRAELDASAVVTMGFCLGGTMSYYATTDPGLALAGAISFYGGLDGSRLGIFEDPATAADWMHGPILAIFGGDDPSITPKMRDRFDLALDEHGVEHEFVTFPGMPHSFFDRTHGEHVEACDESWRLVLRFLGNVAERHPAPVG